MEIKIYNSLDRLYDDVAAEFADIINTKDNPVLGLATGSSPIGVYQRLIKMYKDGELDFSKTTTFNLDEYCGLGEDDQQSYNYFMHDNLFNHINIKDENIHIPNGLIDPKEACDQYNKMLEQHIIDLQILGIGSNGHIAFNEPGTDFDSVTHQDDLDQKTINDNARFFEDDTSKVPTKAITMGLNNIMQANKIVLIATGKNKQEAIKGLVMGELTTSLPASILQDHINVTVYLDEDAASLLL